MILLNLENLYESLYDALNQVNALAFGWYVSDCIMFQYYVYLGGERFVDLGLGTQRVKCKVHEKFRYVL